MKGFSLPSGRRWSRSVARNGVVLLCALIGLGFLLWTGGGRDASAGIPRSEHERALERSLAARRTPSPPSVWPSAPLYQTGVCALLAAGAYDPRCVSIVVIVGRMDPMDPNLKWDAVLRGRLSRLLAGQVGKGGDVSVRIVFENDLAASCLEGSSEIPEASRLFLCALSSVAPFGFDWVVRAHRPTTVVNMRRLAVDLASMFPDHRDAWPPVWGGVVLRNVTAAADGALLRPLGVLPPFPKDDVVVLSRAAVLHVTATPQPERGSVVGPGASAAVWLMSAGAVPFHMPALLPASGAVDVGGEERRGGPVAWETTMGHVDWATKMLDEQRSWTEVCHTYAKADNFAAKQGIRDCLACVGSCAPGQPGINLRLDRTIVLPERLYRWTGVHVECEGQGLGLSLTRL